MLVLNVIFKCAPDKREELRELIRADDILLIEFWKDVDAWMHHRTLPHYARLDELKKGRVLSADIKKYFTDEEA